MDYDKKFAEGVLRRALDYPWFFFSHRMLKCYLTEEVRLHVWTDAERVHNLPRIHDHPWPFRSTILAGRVRNQRFLRTKDRRYREYFYHDVVEPSGRFDSGAKPGDREQAPDRCAIGPIGVTRLAPGPYEVYTEGMSYGQRGGEIHDSKSLDGTVTLVDNDLRDSRSYITVFWEKPRGDGPPAFRGNAKLLPLPLASDAEVLRITSAALEKWF